MYCIPWDAALALDFRFFDDRQSLERARHELKKKSRWTFAAAADVPLLDQRFCHYLTGSSTDWLIISMFFKNLALQLSMAITICLTTNYNEQPLPLHLLYAFFSRIGASLRDFTNV